MGEPLGLLWAITRHLTHHQQLVNDYGVSGHCLNRTCGNDTSNTVTITVDPPVVGGTVSGATTVCEGSNMGSLSLGGEVGVIIGWGLV